MRAENNCFCSHQKFGKFDLKSILLKLPFALNFVPKGSGMRQKMKKIFIRISMRKWCTVVNVGMSFSVKGKTSVNNCTLKNAIYTHVYCIFYSFDSICQLVLSIIRCHGTFPWSLRTIFLLLQSPLSYPNCTILCNILKTEKITDTI